MPDNAVLEQVTLLTEKVGGLRNEALLVVLVVCGFLFVSLIVWMVLRHRDNSAKTAQGRADQEAKDRRARMYSEGMRDIVRQIEVKYDAYIGTLNGTIENMCKDLRAYTDMVAEKSEEQTEVLLRHTNMLQRLVDTSSSMIGTQQSVHIIEDHFLNVIIPEFVRIACQSVERNNYLARKDFVKDKVLQALSSVLFKTSKAISERYSLMVKTHHFFVVTADGYKLALDAWDMIEAEHVSRSSRKAAIGTGVFMKDEKQDRDDHLAIRIQRLCLEAFNASSEKAQDIYNVDEAGHTTTHHHYVRTPSSGG